MPKLLSCIVEKKKTVEASTCNSITAVVAVSRLKMKAHDDLDNLHRNDF